MTWVLDHLGELVSLSVRHGYLAGLPLLLGLVIALPLGWLARRYGFLYPPLIAGSGLLYTIPSLALFILMPIVLGTRILDAVNVIAAMTVYTVALLVRTVADGLGSVPDSVNQSATAMGFGRVARFFRVELPLAVPVIAAGLRVAAVSNVSIVSVASLIGISTLGDMLIDGFQRDITAETIAAIVACLLLALIFDLVIQGVTRVMTPWQRVVRARG